ncbi:Golgi complex component 7-domain-containing protein [Epithele typhae]|uniref:Golgi complex component 7-domain-containing protein n=1 Tax=Epithele typhae TaxID=378194 RepID=UPI00200839BF|nr:Golgi complex component 7-domain-containing protein [Epithele typhae]KAH9918721.1 Golgi complex component 7-domain-containing protein [Epithele typhae]
MDTGAQKHRPPANLEVSDASPTLASSSELLSGLEEHEDVVSWINTVLDIYEEPSDAERSAALTELDRRVSHLVGTLEIASEDTSAHVDRLIEDISRGASRLTYDLHFMRESALSLQTILHNVEAKSSPSMGAETDAALENLHHLDTIKRNVEATREVLREAESWSTLESDVTSLLGEKNYEKAAERLSEASKSMVVFENTPEYDSRRTLMVSLQNQLEASLSSALVAAVNSQDVAVCRNYFSIFSNIQRESEFRNYYYGSRRGPLVEEWQLARLRDCETTSPIDQSSLAFSAFLTTFYDSFVAILQTERTSVPAIFPDPRPTLSALITSTLSALQPSFSQRLEALSTHYGAQALLQLISTYRATEDFAVTTDKIMEKVSYAAPITSEDQRPSAHSRRRSTNRMSLSMSRRNRPSISGTGVLIPPTLGWDTELFEPFVDFQVEYAALETRFVEDALKTVLAAESKGRIDHARVLRERAVDVFGIAEDAIARCTAFTHGYGVLGLVQSVDRLFSAFAEASTSEISARRSGQGGSSMTASASGEDLSDLDYTADDWVDIQALLHFLEAVRTLLDRMVMFESKLRASLVQVSASMRQSRNDPAAIFMSGASRGKLQLLMQSNLNSAELQELLNKVDPEAPPPQSATPGSTFLTPTPPTPGPISELARTTQQALQDTILSPLYKYLSTYASSSLWAAPPDPQTRRVQGTGGGNALSEVSVPTFSLSPSSTMQHVTEGLLNLPRLFEVYADDDALAFSLNTLPFLSPDTLRALSEPAPPAPTDAHAAAGGITHTRRAPSLALAHAPASPALALAPAPLPPEAVAAAWLAALGRALTTHLTDAVLPRIARLSPAGAAQLASDLGYLANIVAALNVDAPALERWRAAAALDDVEGRRRVREDRARPKGVGEGGEAEALDGNGNGHGEAKDAAELELDAAVLAAVAKLRGWA